MNSGRIKMWKHERGYGFIETESDDLFAHIRNLDGISHPSVGMWVTFHTAINPRNGKPEAVNVVLLSSDEADKEQAWASRHQPVRPESVPYDLGGVE